MRTIAKRLKAEREKNDLSQEELAKKAGISQSFIGALESGNQKNSGWLPEIANALGVNAYWLKTGKGAKTIEASKFQGINDDLSDQVQWLIANADNEIKLMFSLMVRAMYQKKTDQFDQESGPGLDS